MDKESVPWSMIPTIKEIEEKLKDFMG